MEEGDSGSIAFLDTTIPRNENVSITTGLFRKATHADKYLQFNSHHPNQHKCSVVQTLQDRAKNFPSSKIERRKQRDHLVNVLMDNGYPVSLINSTVQQRSQISFQRDYQSSIVLPCVQRVSERIARTLNGQHIKVAYKTIRTVASILKKPKDKLNKELFTAIAYKINCKNCEKVYIGQSNPALKTRIKEHKRAIF